MTATVTDAAAAGLLQLMLEVSQRMQVRHPNIATVMGVSTEPVTEDPLLVGYCHVMRPLQGAVQCRVGQRCMLGLVLGFGVCLCHVLCRLFASCHAVEPLISARSLLPQCVQRLQHYTLNTTLQFMICPEPGALTKLLATRL